MDRNRQTLTAFRMAFVLVLVAASCIGCGKPMLYHFKHYHGPFAAIAKSNQTYFHSSQTGKIIEKDPCQKYCEPGCFGYEPTCWTRWPSECAGNCPIQGEDQVVPYEGQVIMEGAPMMESLGAPLPDNIVPSVKPAPSAIPPGTPVPESPGPAVDETRLPPIRVPSIPADVESAVPSPSDSTNAYPDRVPAVDEATRSTEAKLVIVQETESKPVPKAAEPESIAYEIPVGTAGDALHGLDLVPRDEIDRDVLPTKPKKTTADVSIVAVTQPAMSVDKPRDAKPGGNRISHRKPRTLEEKLRVRVRPEIETRYLATIEATARKATLPARQPDTKDSTTQQQRSKRTSAQQSKMLRIVDTGTVIDPKTPMTSVEKTSLKFGDLATKLKNAKPVAAKEVTPAPTRKTAIEVLPTKRLEAAKFEPPVKKQTTLQVSDNGSSVIRFATDKGSSPRQRLTASSGSSVLRFSPISE